MLNPKRSITLHKRKSTFIRSSLVIKYLWMYSFFVTSTGSGFQTIGSTLTFARPMTKSYLDNGSLYLRSLNETLNSTVENI